MLLDGLHGTNNLICKLCFKKLKKKVKRFERKWRNDTYKYKCKGRFLGRAYGGHEVIFTCEADNIRRRWYLNATYSVSLELYIFLFIIYKFNN